MKPPVGLVALVSVLTIATAAVATVGMMAGVPSQDIAHQYWMLKCQGCHRPDASGTPQTAPALAGSVSAFLSLPGGREYLGRVPGVATTDLTDEQLAALLNWTLQHFDAGHVPKDFEPYTAIEIGILRSHPLRTEAASVRAALVQHRSNSSPLEDYSTRR
jgi:hypothetical protein